MDRQSQSTSSVRQDARLFFDEEARSPLFEIYDGDGRKQVEALWQYVRPGKELLIPEGMEANTASGPVNFEELE